MPVDAQGHLGLLRQWRATFDRLNWELPAGTCDQVGESALLTGQRELEEEMGMVSDAWTLLHTTQISPGWTDQVTTLFRADNVRYVGAKPQGPEELHLERHWLNRDEARALLESGEVLETTLTIALLHFVSD
jgi:ADP-ribose pyrophosphatase